MKARQNSDDDNRAYVRDAKMTPAEKCKGFCHWYVILGELVLILLFLVSTLLIAVAIMQG